MRKIAGIVFAVAITLTIGLSALARAGSGSAKSTAASAKGAAATGGDSGEGSSSGETSCAVAHGSAHFLPPLPVASDKRLVRSVLTTSGTFSKCTGGGVINGTSRTVSPPSPPMNCLTLASETTKFPPAVESIRWNTGRTSTVVLSLRQVKGKPTQVTVTGKVTAGLFKGATQVFGAVYKIAPTACVKVPLGVVTYSQTKPKCTCDDNNEDAIEKPEDKST